MHLYTCIPCTCVFVCLCMRIYIISLKKCHISIGFCDTLYYNRFFFKCSSYYSVFSIVLALWEIHKDKVFINEHVLNLGRKIELSMSFVSIHISVSIQV